MTDYPGLTGIPTAHPHWDRWVVTLPEQQQLREKLDLCLNRDLLTHPNYDTFLSCVAHAIQMFRGWAQIADENRLVKRRQNLRQYAAFLKRGSGPRPWLSLVNAVSISRLKETAQCDERTAVSMLLERLVKARTRRGARPLDEVELLVDDLARYYHELFGRSAVTTKGGAFEQLLAATLEVATEGGKGSPHPHLDRYVTKARVVAATWVERPDGSLATRPREFVPSRFASVDAK